MNISNKKTIKTHVSPDKVMTFLQRYFDERIEIKDFMGFYYKFTILDMRLNIFKLQKSPFARACWIKGRITSGKGSEIDITLCPSTYLSLIVGDLWLGVIILQIGLIVMFFPLIILNILILHESNSRLNDYVKQIEEAITALNEENIRGE